MALSYYRGPSVAFRWNHWNEAGIQREIANDVLAGRDALVVMPSRRSYNGVPHEKGRPWEAA
jgi:hypothetical protein